MATSAMKCPQSISLVYDSSNVMAKKTLKYILSLGLFEPAKPAKNRIDLGLDEYRRGEYVVINKGKSNTLKNAENK